MSPVANRVEHSGRIAYVFEDITALCTLPDYVESPRWTSADLAWNSDRITRRPRVLRDRVWWTKRLFFNDEHESEAVTRCLFWHVLHSVYAETCSSCVRKEPCPSLVAAHATRLSAPRSARGVQRSLRPLPMAARGHRLRDNVLSLKPGHLG